MMDVIRQWLIGVTCAAMLVAVADSLIPSGSVKRIGRLVGGLVLLLAVVKPLLGLDYSTLAMTTVPYHEAMATVESELDKTNAELMKTIIGEKIGAYILDKAEVLDAPCRSVAVTCEEGEDGSPYPTAVTVTGPLTAAQRTELMRVIEADLAIPAERQVFESGDVNS